MRRVLRMILVPFLAGGLIMGAAWAGAGLTPAPKTDQVVGKIVKKDKKAKFQKLDVEEAPAGTLPADLAPLPNGLAYAGASKISMEPRPEEYGGVWEQDRAKCETLSENFFNDVPANLEHAANAGTPWPENPNCLYMGGYNIGPVNPITSWDTEYGLYVRSFAVSDTTDTLVLTILDGEGWFWDYKNKCSDCGAKQLSESLANELGISKEGIVIAATHSHTAPEFIGGWGFVPDWYMDQIEDTIRASITEAVTTMEPAVLETGEVFARQHNSERRGTYRSAQEQGLTYLRALALNGSSGAPHPTNPETIATVGAYAAHPTTADEGSGVGHADWPASFEKRLEERFGGIGLHFMTGLGNMTARGGTGMGANLAEMVPAEGAGLRLTNTDIRVAQTTWQQPTTNVPLSALGVPGFFDRKFLEAPASVTTGKNPNTAPCTSASPVSVELPASAARIGDQFALSAAPGEVFANLTNAVKDESGAVVTMPLAQANDALGYMPQNFEMSPIGQQGLGFVAGGVLIVNYEDSYSIDRCVGDMVLETTIDLLEQIK